MASKLPIKVQNEADAMIVLTTHSPVAPYGNTVTYYNLSHVQCDRDVIVHSLFNNQSGKYRLTVDTKT